MNKEFKFNIPNNVFNIFSSYPLDDIIKKYHLDNYYELKQIHSDIVINTNDNYRNNTSGDAIITSKKNIPLVIKTADCIPILLYDKENKVIALVHSGWKGTLNNITSKTVTKMINEFNSKPNNIMVYIYPSIRKCHFEVKDDVYKLFKEKISNTNKYVTKKLNKYYIDLQQIIIDSLHILGINNIYDSGICTYCHNDKFYSYRYNHTDKRNYLIAMIKE